MSKKVDMITVSPSGVYVMIIVCDVDWRDMAGELVALQARLYDYVEVVVSGGLAALYPKSALREYYLPE